MLLIITITICRRTAGKMEAVLNGKEIPDNLAKALVADYERGLTGEIMKYPWQSETCIGEWHYQSQSSSKNAGEFGGYLPPARRNPLDDRYSQQEWHFHPERTG